MAGSPVFNDKTFDKFKYLTGESAAANDRMTIEGTVNKGVIFLGLAIVSAALAWVVTRSNPGAGMGLLGLGLIGGLICALITCFRPQFSSVTGSLYCIFEGLFLGTISSVFDARYQGIALTAVVLTLSIAFLMFLAYRARIIRATPMFTKVIFAATGAIGLAYLVEIVARMFGAPDLLGLWSTGPLGIGISLLIIVVAALNFIVDFNLIEKGSEEGAPKFMEWYAAFGVMVTLFWLYLEILRLLAKLQKR